jgi:acyl dehydratase/NAD(P)-dependent dehydrogenase (short-subunit alcohol dehydrogenase family)
VTWTIHLAPQHVRRFADASGDHNPLHVDERFARATPYGRCIAHGALVTIAALGRVDAERLDHVGRLDVQFKLPVFPGERYHVAPTAQDGRMTRIQVTGGGRLVAVISVVAEPDAPPPLALADDDLPPEAEEPRRMTIDELRELTEPVRTPYACRLADLRDLAAEVAGRALPDTLLTWLAAASYCVGMFVPGRDAVFAGARLDRPAVGAASAAPSSRPATGSLTATVSAADERTGFVVVGGVLEGEAAVRMSLQTFLRPPAPTPDRSSIARHLPASSGLADRNVLVVGASRGLGAAVAGALATQQATVWASYARSAEHAVGLRREFGEERIRLLAFDAADARACRAALGATPAPSSLDGIVVCAAPPAHEMALHPEAVEELLRFVDATVAMTLVPLAHALPLLSPRGWVVVTSSPAIEAPPAAAPQQVVAKAAIEGAAAYCAAHAAARVLVVRPPRMWTDSANTPLGRIGAAAPEQIAAQIVRWAMSEQTSGGAWVLAPDGRVGPWNAAARESEPDAPP